MPRVALVGCAHIHTPGFVKRLRDRDEIETISVWDPESERSARWAGELNANQVSDVTDIWQDDSLDGVVICSQTDLHEELVLAAVDAGKHMFVEKPLGIAARDAYKMAGAIEDADLLFQTGYFQRGIPAHLFVRQQIQAGTFGKISRLRMSNCHSGSLRDIFTPEWLWMTDVERAGVGAFGDLGTHALDLMLWMLGDVSSVAATLKVVTGRYGPDCDETGEALMRFENGVIGSLAAGWVDVADPITLELSGTEGHVVVHDRKDVYIRSSKLEGADGEKPWADLPDAWPHAFELFLDALNGNEAPLVGAKEAAYRSAVMEAMYHSAEAERWIEPAGSV